MFQHYGERLGWDGKRRSSEALSLFRYVISVRRAAGRGADFQSAVPAVALSMNRPFGVPALAGPDRLKAGLQTSGVPRNGSWSQCMRKTKGGSRILRFSVPMHGIKAVGAP